MVNEDIPTIIDNLIDYMTEILALNKNLSEEKKSEDTDKKDIALATKKIKESVDNNEKNIEEANEEILKNMEDYIEKKLSRSINHSKIFFRGHSNSNWNMEPAVFRENLLILESNIIQLAYLRLPDEFMKSHSSFERLCMLQHYGLPTRLLDVTTNPLVALFFACQENKNKEGNYTDGAIYYNISDTYYPESYEIKVLSTFAEMGHTDTLEELMKKLTAKNLVNNDMSKESYLKLFRTLNSNYYVSPPHNNDRIIRQNGAFIIAGTKTENMDEKIELEDLKKYKLKKCKNSLNEEFDKSYFIIPAKSKKDILEELDLCNINKATLFPELEHQMNYIKNKKLELCKNDLKVEPITKKPTDNFDLSANDKIGPITIIEPTFEEINEIISKNIIDNIKCKKGFITRIIEETFEIYQKTKTVDWWKKETTNSLMINKMARNMGNYCKYKAINKKIAEKIVDEIIKLYMGRGEDEL
ncbi:hypothetical protein J3E07_001450 [Methanococcus voltae]|uniref:FRG domain-containing protein n=1 Tax=Methanococcus voltae TaxID=2188 RepID=A0A8J7S288_METVO|nr:FRG domain-containing protein [Methanococcus voltae]MBP2202010.1 hypothetical protein [Methanococcus voltae]